MPRIYKRKTVEENILERVLVGDGCWEWDGPHDDNGYAIINVGRRRILAHRAVYEYVHGPFPEGLEGDHVCRNRGCVRPDPKHVEPVTHAENIRRSGPYKKWTHCAKGHPLSGDNLAPVGRGKVRCKICKREAGAGRSRELANSGLCKCGRALDGDYKSCARCRQRAITYWHKHQPCPPKPERVYEVGA